MSRRDKRAGRARYSKSGDEFLDYLDNLGKSYHAGKANLEFRLVLICFREGLIQPSSRSHPAVQMAKNKIGEWFNNAVGAGDHKAFREFADTLEAITNPKAIDPLAYEILLAYGELRGVEIMFGKGFSPNLPLPSGKEIAEKVDKMRLEEGLPPHKDITADAIREKALRLGLKLKGKRKKKK